MNTEMQAVTTVPRPKACKPSEHPVFQRIFGVGIVEGRIFEFADVRLKKAASSRFAAKIYCDLWLQLPTRGRESMRGHGWAGGGGYCRNSEAFEQAIENAGISLSREVGGRGMGAVAEALTAIGVHFGIDRSTIAILGV